jgi:bromodomain and WD repeat domain-containing protein 1/3
MKKRPLMISTGNPTSALNGPPKKFGRGGRKRRVQGDNDNEAGPSNGLLNTTNMNNRTSTQRLPVGRPRRQVDDEEEAVSSSSESSNSDDSTAVEEDLDLSSSSSSDSDSSEYSDWIDVEDQQRLEPPKRSKRKPVERRTYSPADSVENNGNAKKRGPKGIKKIPLLPNGEIPDEYKPPEWLSEVIPKKAPYYPQMGDEIVYFRQGHERYFEHVHNKKLYNLTGKYEPWKQLELREHEFCKVIGIKYEIRPPRLCCLKLALMTDTGNMTDKHFTIKYHDIPDVLDFLVLKQTFDTAISRNWGPGDRFRCMIDDKWWIGEIESHQALQDEFPDSLFMCFKVRWDNSEYEFMSPWDMEPIDEDRLPSSIGGSVPVLPEEIQAILYRPKNEEWPRGDRESTCRRIVGGLEQVMGLAIADAFLTPVDLNTYPTYAYVVEYPIDLSTIKSRFENHFYRRITSAQFDVRYLATNAEKFNEKHSNIVKHARIITDLCLRILR